MRVLAIIAARNEADVIGATIGHLVDQGVDVFLIDDGSTDDTFEIARRFLNRGVIGVERFSNANVTGSTEDFAWRAILERKVEISAEQPADWYIHQDADEFRESPWRGVRLREAIEEVDALGFNAIDFEVFEFRLTNAAFQPGADPRETLRHFAPGKSWDKLQVKCWKRQPTAVDLSSSAGHDVNFTGRRVFPIRFILRHYPFRSEFQAARKVFEDRIPRLREDEKANGWHIHYANFVEGHPFTESPDGLSTFDEAAARLKVSSRHRGTEDLERSVGDLSARVAASEADLEATREALGLVSAELADAMKKVASISRLERSLDERTTGLEEARAQIQGAVAEATRAVAEAARQAEELRQLYASRSWRWTSPFRSILNWLIGWHRAPFRRD